MGSPDGLLQQSGLALTDDYLAWDNGDCLELLDLHSGKAKVLEYPPADGTGGVWAVISERYVAWQTNGSPDRGTEIVAYDLKTRRRFVVAHTGALGGAIALSDTTLYWDCDASTAADPSRGLIRRPRSGERSQLHGGRRRHTAGRRLRRPRHVGAGAGRAAQRPAHGRQGPRLGSHLAAAALS